MIVLILVLVFLFAGEPDLWDNLFLETLLNKTLKSE